MSLRRVLFLLVFCLLSCISTFAQTETATLSGLITDPQGRPVPGVEVQVTNQETNVSVKQSTNDKGLYVVVGLKPGRYRVSVTKEGFRRIDLTDLVLNVQDVLSRNLQLQLGPVETSITISAETTGVNTESAAVSTVVDRQFAENLPLNGRSFQTLIQLTPGVVLTPSTASDGGQFSVNGQRASSNYWMIDGVSANIAAGASFGQGNAIGGALPGFSAQGGTNSLVSVDALQEFRIQTSTYAPEFGRTPGGQISILTRSGTNQFHGTLFDYLRNDVLDADDWFANRDKLAKPKERQNDFGGTFSGPIRKNRAFFFFSYEGLRLRLPRVVESVVPSVSARQAAIPATQPFLNAFPLPNGADLGSGNAAFNASFSSESTLNASSIRIDHTFNDKLTLFGRYNYSPSEDLSRLPPPFALSVLQASRISTQTTTVGATWRIATRLINDSRLNYSRNNASSSRILEKFGGAIPIDSSQISFPDSFTFKDSELEVGIFSTGFLVDGRNASFLQRQVNLVDNLSVQSGQHSLKFGVDYRRLMPMYDPLLYEQFFGFLNVASVQSGNLFFSLITSSRHVSFTLQNLGIFGQDTWRANPRLTLSYGVRWDVDFAPDSDPRFASVTNSGDLANLALAAPGTPVFGTTYGNVAPRVGIAYALSQKQGRETVLRGGFGVFFDLVTQELGNLLSANSYPFGGLKFIFGGTYPLSPSDLAPPPISVNSLSSGGILGAYDPSLKLPYTLAWSFALEQSLGSAQSISASYIGAAGRRLLLTEFVSNPNPSFSNVNLVGNHGASDYHALQVQFQRRLSHGLQALASYSWAHSIDNGSASSAFGNQANIFTRQLGANANRGPSDFDMRHVFSAGVTYAIPAPRRINTLANSVLRGWALENVIQGRTAPPVNVFTSSLSFAGNPFVPVRPDLVLGQPVYLRGSPLPGGKALNSGAFTNPPTTPAGCVPGVDFPCNAARQGDLGRNALRGFGAFQWDFAVHRNFPIRESLKLQFRAEMFNVLNHPNFGPPATDLSNTVQFGQSTQTLGQSLSPQGAGFGAFSPLYEIGGPRSIQFALRLFF